MSKLSKKEIKVDRQFDKFLSDHVTKHQRRTLTFSIRGSQAVLSGEENAVDLAKENLDKMNVADLIEAMKVMESDENLRFKTTEKVEFPLMKVKYKGQLWTVQKAREQLGVILNILGFGKGGTKKFKEAEDEPAGWPDEHSFEAFEHPSYANMTTINDINESIFKHHGYDPNNHPFDTVEPETPVKKKNKKRKVSDHEVEDDPNDNSFEVDEPGSSAIGPKKRKLVPYEELRESNILERESFMKSAGLLPHSKVRKNWEKSTTIETVGDEK